MGDLITRRTGKALAVENGEDLPEIGAKAWSRRRHCRTTKETGIDLREPNPRSHHPNGSILLYACHRIPSSQFTSATDDAPQRSE